MTSETNLLRYMPKINFLDLDLVTKRAVFWLSDQAATVTASVVEAAAHAGEILEAAAFMREHPKGSMPHTILAARLQQGSESAESILTCIQRAAPEYRSMADRADAELHELLADLEEAGASDART